VEPDTIFINGDLVDFYAISRFNKDPERELKLQEELDEAVNVLRQIKKPTHRPESALYVAITKEG